jgi:hypothetical protein
MTTTWLRLVRPALIVLFAFLMSGGTAQAQLVPYDSFVGPKLDADKWRGRQFVTREDGTGALLEIQREITPVETLILQARAVGGDASDTGLFTAENALQFRHSSKLSDIAFAVVVRSAQVTGCAIGADAAVGARGVYPLFNDGTGDVVAIAEVTRTSSTALEVLASLVHRSAEGDTVLGSVSLGAADLNVRVRLRVKWDAANSAVRVHRDAAAAVLPYANTVVSAAGARKYLGAWTSVPDCTDGTTPTAGIAALFNNVRVNQ